MIEVDFKLFVTFQNAMDTRIFAIHFVQSLILAIHFDLLKKFHWNSDLF